MMGRDHVAFGLTAYFGSVAAVDHLTRWAHPSAAQGALGVLVAAGAALAPDLDEHQSLSGHVNVFSRLPIFGGHRRRTHTIAAVLAVTVIAVIASHDTGQHRYWLAGIVGFMAVGGAAGLWTGLWKVGITAATLTGIAAGYLAWRYVPGGWWIVAAVTAGYVSHLVGDQPWQLPLFLPFSQVRSRFALWQVGGPIETYAVGPAVHLSAVIAGLAAFSPATLTSIVATLKP